MLALFLLTLEYIWFFINLSNLQIKLHDLYLKEKLLDKFQKEGGIKLTYLFADFQKLQRICTHSRVLQNKSIIDKEKQDKRNLLNDEYSASSLQNFISNGERSTTQ